MSLHFLYTNSDNFTVVQGEPKYDKPTYYLCSTRPIPLEEAASLEFNVYGGNTPKMHISFEPEQNIAVKLLNYDFVVMGASKDVYRWTFELGIRQDRKYEIIPVSGTRIARLKITDCNAASNTDQSTARQCIFNPAIDATHADEEYRQSRDRLEMS